MRRAHRTLSWVLLTTAGLGSGCATAPAPAPEPAAPPLPLQVHWVRNSAEYVALYEQTYRLATAALERRVEGLESGTWAVAVDADETLISNSEQSKEQALGAGGSFEERWDEWVKRRKAPPLPGAIAFLERVRELGGKIAVVTNRRERHCQPTEDNFRAIDLPYDVVLCRGETGDKRPRWKRVEEGKASESLPPLEIVMWIGDNIHDFPDLDQELRFASPEAFSEFGDRFFVLPNPLYGSWEENAPD